ncbi:hypothetical protein ABPG72_001254 [Tetrahymena utriculariae]
MDKNRDYSKEFILADLPFKASRTIQQMVQLRQKFPNISGSSKQNVEQKNFQRGARRTMSTFKIPQSMCIDTDDFYLKPEEIRMQLSLSTNKSALDFKSQRFDLNKTIKYRDTYQQMYTSQQIFKDITLQMTDPVYKLNKEKLKEMNKQSIQKAELQLQQQQLKMLKQQNQDASIQQIGKIGINESRSQLSEQKGKLESSKLMVNLSKIQLQTKKTIPTEFLHDSIGNQNNSISIIQNQECYSNIPQQIQSKHQIQNLLHQIEENNKQLNEYQLFQTQHLIPSQEDIKFDQDQSIMVKKNPIFKSKKFFGRKNSCNIINLSKQKDTIFQMNQTVINQTQIPGNQIFVDESSMMIGKKNDYVADNTTINPILSFQTEFDVRPSNPIAGSSVGYFDSREGDTTLNNNPFLQDEDLSILVNQTGEELLIIKIPNLQNYKIQPLELFDSYLNQDPDPLQLIKESSIRAYSRWVMPDGESLWKDCQVIKYNPTTKRFLIKWTSNDRMKEVTRLNLMYEWENEEIMNKRNKEALKKREQLLYYMGMKIFVNEEKDQDKSIYYSKQTLLNVVDKVFNSKNSRKLKRMNYKRVVEEILEMFKYEVIKFACEINTVPSLDHFFEAYFPELKQTLKKKPNLLYDVVMNCQNYPERLLEEQKVQHKKKTDQSSLIKHKTFHSLSLEKQKEQAEQLLLESDNQNQTQFNRKEQYKNLKKLQAQNALQSKSQKNLLNNTQLDDQSIDKINQDEQAYHRKKKSAFFQNIQSNQEQKSNLEALNESDQKKQLENEIIINQDEQNNDQFKDQLENKRSSGLFVQNNKYTFFKSANVTQAGSIYGISQINFKRSQYLLSPNINEFISLRQTQQEEMSQIDSILSQVKFNDYEFLTEEVYTFTIKRKLEDQQKELQIHKIDGNYVFKYTQSEKLQEQYVQNEHSSEQAQIFFQHYAIPHPYFPFLKEKLLQNFYFSNEYHNTVLKRIVPNIAKRIQELRSINIFQFLKEIKSPYQLPSLFTIQQMNGIVKQKVSNLSKNVEKFEVRLIFTQNVCLTKFENNQIMIYEMQSLNKKKNQQDSKKYILWTDQFYQSFVDLTVKVIQSHLIDMIRQQIDQFREQINKFFSIIPFEFLQNELKIDHIYQKQFESQKICFLREANEVYKQLLNIAPSVKFKKIDKNIESQQASQQFFKASKQDFELSKTLISQHVKARRSTLRDFNTASFSLGSGNQSSQINNSSIVQDNEVQLLMEECWPFYKEANIIYKLYKQIVNVLLTDKLTHLRFEKIDSKILKPIFRIKAKFLNEKIPAEKKQLDNITKRINFKRLQNLSNMEDMIDNGREKFWKLEELNATMKDIFYEIAGRNFEEIDPNTYFESIKEKTITIKRLGWFNLNCFTIIYEPSLPEFESRFKLLIKDIFDQICKINIYYRKDHLINYSDIQEKLNSLDQDIEEFLTYSFYGLYSFFIVLQRFEFYFLFSHKYERYLQKRVDTDELEIVFSEVDKMESDLNFLKSRLLDEMPIGVFLIDTKEFKETLITEIKQKILFSKKILKEKFKKSIDTCMALGDKILTKMQNEPKDVREYIKLSLYLQGEELFADFNCILNLIHISQNIIEKQQLLLIDISQEDLVKIIGAELIHREVVDLKNKKDQKKEQEHPKFIQMHLEEKEKVKKKIEEVKEKVEQIRKISSFNQVEQQSRDCEAVITILYQLRQQVRQLQQDGINLELGFDSEIDIEKLTEDFENYEKIWQYTQDWTTKKQIWLFKPLINSSQNAQCLQIADIRDISYTLERGNKILREVEPFFQRENPEILPLIEAINQEITDFQSVYELLVQVKDESFKIQHWHQIFDFVYDKDEEKRKKIKKMDDQTNFNLYNLITDGVLDYIQSIKVIAVEAKDEFKSQQSVSYIEQEFSNLKFQIHNYFSTLVIIDIRQIIDRLRNEEFKVQELLRNKAYQKNDYLEKLKKIKHFVKHTRKVLKIIAKIQDEIVKFAPIFRFKESEQKYKGIEILFRKVVSEFKKHTEEITKRGMGYFMNLFSLENPDNKNQSDIFEIFFQIYSTCEKIQSQVYHIVNAVRQTHPRYAFVSDELIFEISQSLFLPQEFLNKISLLFPGVKEFKCQPLSDDPQSGNENVWEINKIINHYDEVIELAQPIPYVLKYMEKPPNLGMVNLIESEMKKYLRFQIMQHLKPVASKNYNYWKIWNLFLIKKYVIFQSFYLINDILFMHDLTMLLSLEQKYQDIKRFYDHLKLNFDDLISYYQTVIKVGLSATQSIQFTQAIIQIQQHLDILQRAIKQVTFSLNSFEYLILPKFTLQIPIDEGDVSQMILQSRKTISESLQQKYDEEEAEKKRLVEGHLTTNSIKQNQAQHEKQIQNLQNQEIEINNSNMPLIAYKSDYINSIKKKPQDLQITLNCFFHKIPYSFELVPTMNNFIFTENTLRVIHQAVVSISSNFSCILRGSPSSGKKSIINSLAAILGRSIFECNFQNQSLSIVEQILLNSASCNYWINVTNFENLPLSTLSLIANISFQIRKAISMGTSQLSYYSKCVDVSQYFGLFGTMNILPQPSDISFQTMPKSIQESFRIITFLKPDSNEIIKNYLLIIGFDKEEVHEKSQKLNFFFEFICTVTNNQQFSYSKRLTYIDFQQIIHQRSEKQQRLISLKSILVILRNALFYIQETRKSQTPYTHQTALKAAIENYFKGIMPSGAFSYMKNIFNKLFMEMNSLQSVEYVEFVKQYNDQMNQFFDFNKYPFQSQFSEQAGIILPLILKNVPLIIYGPHSSKKNLFIQFLSFLVSVSKEINFNVNFLNVDSVERETLLSSKKEFDVDDDNQGSILFKQKKKGFLNLLIDTMKIQNNENSEIIDTMLGKQTIFSTYVANTITEKLKNTKKRVIERSQNDWIVVDGCAECMNQIPQNHTIEELLDGFENKQFSLGDGDFLRVPSAATVVFSLEKLQNISPSSFNKYMIFFFSNQMVKLSDEYTSWYSKKVQQNNFFSKFHTIAKSMFVYFLEPFFQMIESIPSSHLIFKRNQKSELKCFLDYLEIFLNEIRKFEIAIGEYEAEGMNLPSNNLRRERKNHITSSLTSALSYRQDRSSENIPPIFAQNNQNNANEPLIKEESDEERSSDSDSNNNSEVDSKNQKGPKHKNVQKNSKNYVDSSNNETIYNSILLDTESRLVSSFESAFIFCMTWALANQIKDSYQQTYVEFLNDQIERYCRFRFEYTNIKYTNESYPFAIDLRILLREKDVNIFDYIFDIHKQKWIKWRNFYLEECSEISGSFESNNLNNREIVRLNPLAISIVNTKLTQEKREVYIPENILFIETRASKITKFFIQYFSAYCKPYILLAQQSNGITSIVKNKLKNLLEYHSFSCINNSISRGTTISNFQKRIEKNLVWKNSNHLTSIHQTISLIFIDDLNLSKDGISPIGAIRSLVQHDGWFSNNKFKFINFSMITLLAVFSYFDINSIQPSINTVLFEKITSLKVPDLEKNDIISIFQLHNNSINHPGMKANKKVTGIIQDFCSLIGLLNDKYRNEFKKISCQFNANLSIRKGLEIVKNLNSFSFYDKSAKAINYVNLIKSLVFLINQFYSSEFIHQPYPNMGNLEKLKIQVKEIDQISFKTISEARDKYNSQRDTFKSQNDQSLEEKLLEEDEEEEDDDDEEDSDSSEASQSFGLSRQSDNDNLQSENLQIKNQNPNFQKNKNIIKKKFKILNLNQIDEIRKKFYFSSDKKIEWFLGMLDLPQIEFKEDTSNQLEDSKEQQQQQINSPNKKLQDQGNQSQFFSNQGLAMQSSKFKIEYEDKKINNKAKHSIHIFDESKQEGSSANSKEVEDESLSDLYDNSAALITQLALKSAKLIPTTQNQESGDLSILQFKQQQLQLVAQKQAKIEERRFIQQEKKTGSQHYQISRDVTNAQKLQYISNQNQIQGNAAQLQKTDEILQKLENVEFMFSFFSTLPDQFTIELTNQVVQELLLAQQAENNLKTQRTIQSQKKLRGSVSVDSWKQILKQRQDILFFNLSLIHKNKLLADLNQQISKQNTKNLNEGAQGIKSTAKLANLEMSLFEELDFIYLNDKRRKKILLFLVQQLLQFCFHTDQAQSMEGLNNKKQVDLNKMFDDFQQKQLKKVNPLKKRSDSFMNTNIAKQQSQDSLKEKSQFSPSQNKSQQGGTGNYASSSINILQIPQSQAKKKNQKDAFKFSPQQMEEIENLKNNTFNQDPLSSTDRSNMLQYTSRGGDLLDFVLIQEVNINCFLTHAIKLIHLLQSSSQNIYLKSTLSQRITEHLVYYSCSLVSFNAFEFTIQNEENVSKTQQRFQNCLFSAVQNLFIEENQIIVIYIKLSSNLLVLDEKIQENQLDETEDLNSNSKNAQKLRLESISNIYDIINHIVEGGEVQSLFTTQQLEFLMQKWNMKTKYPRFNNYILNYIFSLRLKTNLRFILHYDLQVRQDNTLECLQNEFNHMFQQFTKLNIYYIPLSDDESNQIQNMLFEEMFKYIPDFINSKHKVMVMQAYSKELEVQKIFEDYSKQNFQKTYEETYSLFYLTRSVVFNQIRFKIEKLRRKGGFFKIIQEMEKKSIEFRSEIENAELEFVKIKETKKKHLRELKEAEEKFYELKNLEESFNSQEKTLQDLVNKCTQLENQYKSIQSQMNETAYKIGKISKNSWNDEIKPTQFVQIKQMTTYILIFLIGLHRNIPDKYNISMQQLADDVVDSIDEVNKNSNNFNNIDLYREKFSQIISDSDEFKNIITTFKDEHIKSDTYDLFKCLNKEAGSVDHGFMISLTGNLNIHQREILKYIDFIIELYRITLEVRSLQTSSTEQKENLKQLKAEREKCQIEKNFIKPRQIIKDYPALIEKMKKEQRNLMVHIVQKKDGQQQFNGHLEKFKMQFKHLINEESCQLINNSYLQEISIQLALQVTFLFKYPYYFLNKFQELIQDCLQKSQHLKNTKLFNALYNPLYYFQILSQQIPLNQDLLDKITITDFLYENDLYYYFWVNDKTGIYQQYFKKKYEKTIVVESNTLVEKESYQNIEKALQEGGFLLMRNIDEKTIQQIMPIIEWKYKRMMKLLRFIIQNSESEQIWYQQNIDPSLNLLNYNMQWHNQSLFEFNDLTRKQPLLFNGKEITVNKNFRLMLITSNINFSFSHSIFTKIILLQCEVEDEIQWKQAIFDHAVNNLNFEAKQNQVQMKIDHFTSKRDNMSKLFSQISNGLEKCTTCEDTEFMRMLIDNSEQIKKYIGAQQNDSLNVPIINREHSDEDVSSPKRIIKELIQVGENKGKKNNLIEKIEFEQDVEEEQQEFKTQEQDKKINDLINNEINHEEVTQEDQGKEKYSQQLKKSKTIQAQDLQSAQSFEGTQTNEQNNKDNNNKQQQLNVLPQGSATNTRRSMTIGGETINNLQMIVDFNQIKQNQEATPKQQNRQYQTQNSISKNLQKKRKILQVQTSKQRERENTIGFISQNYFQLDEIILQNACLQEILDFLYAIKLNYINLEKALGKVYSFSDIFFFMIVQQACVRCKQLKVTPSSYSSQPSKIKKTFIKKFCETVFYLLYSSLADDHRLLFSFYLSMMYSRGTKSFSEKEWRLFLNWQIPKLNSQVENNDENFIETLLQEEQNKTVKHRRQHADKSNKVSLKQQYQLDKNNINKLNSKIINFYKIPIHIIAPLQCYIQEKQSLLEKFVERKELLVDNRDNSFSRGGYSPVAKILGLKEKILKKQQIEQEKQEIEERGRQSSQSINETPKRSQRSSQSNNFSLVSRGNSKMDDSFFQSLDDSSPSRQNEYNPLFKKFFDRQELNSPVQIDDDEVLENDIKKFQSPFKTPKQILNNSIQKLTRVQVGDSNKPKSEVNFKNIQPQVVMEKVSKKLIHLMGKELIEKFIESYNSFQAKNGIKMAVNSLVEQPDQWIEFFQKSLSEYEIKDEILKEINQEIRQDQQKNQGEDAEADQEDIEEDEEDQESKKQKLYQNYSFNSTKYIPYIPKEILQNCSNLQLLFIFKHFRPDFLPQVAEYVSQKILRSYIDYDQAPFSLENHCEQDWQRRPTILLHDQVQNRIYEKLELLQSIQNHENQLLRIALGYTSIKSIIDQINQAAGAGRWILLEEIEQMETNDLKYLLKSLDQELEASTTTNSFRVWITHSSTLSRQNSPFQFKPFDFNKNSEILLAYYQTCWKIYYTTPKNIQQSMQRYYFRSIHDYRYNSEQTKVQNPKAKQGKEADQYITKIEKEITIKKNMIYSNVVQMMRKHNIRQGIIPYPFIETIDDGFFNNQSSLSVAQQITSLSPKYLNIFSLIDYADKKAVSHTFSSRHIHIDTITNEKENYKTIFNRFQNKFKFSLAFLHNCLGRKRELTNTIIKSYDSQLDQNPREIFETDLDFQQEIQSVFNILQYYSSNPKIFLQSYFKMVYGYNNSYYINMMLHFVFSNMEGTVKLLVKDQSYLLYDFNSGVFDYVEEGITKILAQQFPTKSDPLDLFFSSFNSSLVQDYTKSKQFIRKINIIEDEWLSNPLVKSLKYLEKIKKKEQFNDNQKDVILKDINFKKQQKNIGSADIQFNQGILSPILRSNYSGQATIQKSKTLQNKFQSEFNSSKQADLSLNKYESEKGFDISSNENLRKPSIANMLSEQSSQKLLGQQQQLTSQQNNENRLSIKNQELKLFTKNSSQGLLFGSRNQSKELQSPKSPPIPELLPHLENNEEMNFAPLQKSFSSNFSQNQEFDQLEQLINKISHQQKSFFKVYYRNIMNSHEKYKDLKSTLELLLKNLNYEFHLKNIKFLKYHQNVQFSYKQPDEYPEFIKQWISTQKELENQGDLFSFRSKQNKNLQFAFALSPNLRKNSELLLSPNRSSQQFSFSPQSSQNRQITQMSQSPTMGSLFGTQQKSSFSEKIRQSRRESTSAHIFQEEQKKYMKQQENQKIISSRRESSLKFGDLGGINKDSIIQDESDKDKSSGNSSNSSESSSEEQSSDDVDIVEDIEKNTFKTTILNECVILFRLIMQIKTDIRNVLDYISNQFDLQPLGQRNYLKQLIYDIQQNTIPETWRKLSFKIFQRNLANYLSQLFQKIQYTQILVERGPNLQMPTVIQIDRLVDSHTFLGSYLYNYAEANNIDIHQLKFVLQKTTYTEIQKNIQPEHGFYIKGLYLTNGTINKDNLFLIEEEIRQFQSEFPIYLLKIERKIKNRQEIYQNVSINCEQSIAIELNDSGTQVLRYDMENEFVFQQLHPIDLYNYDGTQINAETSKLEQNTINSLTSAMSQGMQAEKRGSVQQKKNVKGKQRAQNTISPTKGNVNDQNQAENPSKDDFSSYKQAQQNFNRLAPKELKFSDIYSQSKYNFVIRIPFKNPCTSSSYSYMQTKYYLYLNSRKPQDFWELKGTTLFAQKQAF